MSYCHRFWIYRLEHCDGKGKSSLRNALGITEFFEATHIDMIEHASVGMPSDAWMIYWLSWCCNV